MKNRILCSLTLLAGALIAVPGISAHQAEHAHAVQHAMAAATWEARLAQELKNDPNLMSQLRMIAAKHERQKMEEIRNGLHAYIKHHPQFSEQKKQMLQQNTDRVFQVRVQ